MYIEKYIITSAINNSKVFEKGLETLKGFCENENATLLILPIRYNPSRLTEEEIIYDKNILEFLQYDNFSICDKLTVLPEVKILPTAIKPLSGLASLGHETHTLIASPRIHLETIASLEKNKPKFILSTGCITEENYTKSKIGAKADFHHSTGAVIVEVDTKNGHLHFRQVSIDNEGVMCDIDKKYNGYSVEKIDRVEAIVYGDLHLATLSEVVRTKGLYDEDSLLNICNPKEIILHDLLSVETASHHNIGDYFRNYIIAKSDLTIYDEIKQAIDFVSNILERNIKPVIISSNHNEHLTQMLNRVMNNGFKEVNKSNVKLICDLIKFMIDEIDSKVETYDNILTLKVPDIFRIMMLNEFGSKIVYPDYSENYRISSFDVSLHGDVGINGSRSLGNLQLHTNTKVIHGHLHSAKRIDGVLSVGTSSKLNLNYNQKGISTWSHTHAIIHRNNKAQLITQNSLTGEYRVNEKANNRMKTFKLLDKKEFTPHFTEENDDLDAIENGMKYKIVTKEGDVIYCRSYRHLIKLTKKSNRFCSTLIKNSEKDGWNCIYLI